MIVGETIRELKPWQVHDPARGSFFVGLTPTKERKRGLLVYVDSFGRHITINQRRTV